MADIDAFLESLGPPKITIGGKTYVGRHLSLEEWAPFEDRARVFYRSDGSDEEITPKQAIARYREMTRVIKDYCDCAFVPSWRDLLNPFRKTVGELVAALPPAAMLKAAQDFFESQGRAMNALQGVVNTGEVEVE